MRFDRDNFHDCHELYRSLEGKAVWIVGSDPTLSDYPDDFLEGKIGITLHLAHIKFPRATFRYSSEYDRSEFLLSKYPDYASLPLIAGYPMYGKTRDETARLVSPCSRVYFHKRVSYLPTGVRGEVDAGYTRAKIRQTMGGRASYWGAHGSCLHTCVYMAVLMGAAQINVIGSGHGLQNVGGKDHFSGADEIHQGMRTGDTFTDPKIAYPVIEQTIALKDGCEANGIEFNWFASWTPTMDRKIEIDESLLAEMKKRAVRHFGPIKRLYRFLVKRPYTRLFIAWR